jgi:hypothetical protein
MFRHDLLEVDVKRRPGQSSLLDRNGEFLAGCEPDIVSSLLQHLAKSQERLHVASRS